MAQTLTKIRILISSPGDVQEERDRTAAVVDQLSREFREYIDVMLETVRWETHAAPGVGEDAQAVVQPQLGDFDIFVGIFWTRIGSPTRRALSGSVEELEWALARVRSEPHRRRVLVYFSTRPTNPHDLDLEQFSQVQALQKRLMGEGLFIRTYTALDEFEGAVRDHLRSVVRDLQAGLRVPVPRSVHGAVGALEADPLEEKVRLDVAWDRSAYRPGKDLARAVIRVTPNEQYFEELLSRASDQRIEVHHTLIVDVSGSMNQPQKYPRLLDAADAYFDTIGDRDLLTLLPFSTQHGALLRAAPVADLRRAGFRPARAIDQWPHRFSETYMSGALGAALGHLQTLRRNGFHGVHRVLCMSDGHIHDAVYSKMDLANLLGGEARVDFLGFGDDFDLKQAEALVGSHPLANVRFVEANGSALVEYFAHLAHTSQRIVVRNATVEVEFASSVTCFNVFACRPHERLVGRFDDRVGATVTLPIGNVESRKSYIFLLEVRPWKGVPNIGKATFTAETPAGPVTSTVALTPRFADEAGSVDHFVEVMARSVQSLTTNEREARIDSVRARIQLYELEGRAHRYIAALRRELEVLERGGDVGELSESDQRYAAASDSTCTRPAFD